MRPGRWSLYLCFQVHCIRCQRFKQSRIVAAAQCSTSFSQSSSTGTIADDNSICDMRTAPISRSGSSSYVLPCRQYSVQHCGQCFLLTTLWPMLNDYFTQTNDSASTNYRQRCLPGQGMPCQQLALLSHHTQDPRLHSPL